MDYTSSIFDELREAELIGSYVLFDKSKFLLNHINEAELANKIIKGDNLLIFESVMNARDQAIL